MLFLVFFWDVVAVLSWRTKYPIVKSQRDVNVSIVFGLQSWKRTSHFIMQWKPSAFVVLYTVFFDL
jgi:hypothetical protein